MLAFQDRVPVRTNGDGTVSPRALCDESVRHIIWAHLTSVDVDARQWRRKKEARLLKVNAPTTLESNSLRAAQHRLLMEPKDANLSDDDDWENEWEDSLAQLNLEEKENKDVAQQVNRSGCQIPLCIACSCFAGQEHIVQGIHAP